MQQRQESEIVQILKRLLFRAIFCILRPLRFYYSEQLHVSESIAKKAEGRKILGGKISKVSDICKPHASSLSSCQRKLLKRQLKVPKFIVTLGRQRWSGTRGYMSPQTQPLPAQCLSAIPDPSPGTAGLDGTGRLETHLERIKEIRLLAWLRAASVHGRGNITMETWPRPDADVRSVLPWGQGARALHS